MEKKYKIEGDDVVIDVSKLTANEFMKLYRVPDRNQGKYNETKPDEIRLWGVANNKDIINKLDKIFGYNKDVVEGKWDKFRKYWEELGKPSLEIKIGNRWEDVLVPGWFNNSDYRIKGDPNWEVRLAWVNSGKTFEIEYSDGKTPYWWAEAGGVRGTN